MSLTSRGLIVAVAIAFSAVVVQQRPVSGQSVGGLVTIAPASVDDVRRWDERIDRMMSDRELRIAQVQEDTLIPGRRHERLDQVYRDIRVQGGGVTRQLDGNATVSVFGTLYEGIDLDPTPGRSVDEARAAMAQAAGSDPAAAIGPELMIRPKPEGGYGLVYVGHAMSGIEMMTFVVDADTGAVIDRHSDFERQVVGLGRGVHGDDKKISARPGTGLFLADDRLRPARITTYDAKGDFPRLVGFLNGQPVADSDIASDTDNLWTDGPSVDAHAHAGWYYDYLFKRFGRRGVDGNDLRIAAFVHPVRLDDIRSQPPSIVGTYYLNAFYCATCGPSRQGAILLGEGAPAGFVGPGITVHSFASALDVVAHELTHAVTGFTSRLPNVSEGGSLNEAFSDIIGLSTEFFYQPPGIGRLRADYVMGEDLSTPLGSFLIRSISNPSDSGNPDHFSRRNPSRDIHFDSTIVSHAFYLTIEGGTNRTSGLSVRGVGASNREQMEKVFFRALTMLMPPGGTFALARLTTIQAARDLYGAGSAAERAVTEAWDAVGVQERTTPSVTFSPDPVRGSRTPCATGFPTPNWIFTTTMSAAARGLTVNTWNITFRDAARNVLENDVLTGNDFAQLFRSCGQGSRRVPPQADACTTLCVALAGRSSGFVSFAFDAVDDAGARVSLTSKDLPLLAPPGAGLDVSDPQPMGRPQFRPAR